jgi:hypothetical protein
MTILLPAALQNSHQNVGRIFLIFVADPINHAVVQILIVMPAGALKRDTQRPRRMVCVTAK